ncbi:hypothetical protein ABT324_06595 [Saccharopolyspora sp. NPDC000359]|uniref:hypothetical protein n=1 Tax=Saccharopolyspora sp. NPDC000359 TaxID=3154251 RepID=UPI00331C9F35
MKVLAGIIGALMWSFAFGAAVAGSVALLGGLHSTGEGPPTCDGKVMHRGDQCLITFGEQRSSVGYDEMVRRMESAPREGVIIGSSLLGGAVVLTLGGWGLVRWAAR